MGSLTWAHKFNSRPGLDLRLPTLLRDGRSMYTCLHATKISQLVFAVTLTAMKQMTSQVLTTSCTDIKMHSVEHGKNPGLVPIDPITAKKDPKLIQSVPNQKFSKNVVP